jgi:diguanylate cyclase (GGDEF)-like protein
MRILYFARIARRVAGVTAMVFTLAARPAAAACLPSADPEIRAYEIEIGKDPASVAERLAASLSDAALTDSRRAQLLAVYAEALSVLDRHAEVRAATTDGMKLLTDQRDPVYLNLLATWAANTFDETAIPGAIETVEGVRKLQPEGSAAEACMLIALGRLHLQNDRTDGATAALTRAYRMSAGEERAQQRVLAADALSVVMRDVRDFEQALDLNREVLEWDLHHAATYSLATTRLIRAAILRSMGKHQEAIEELQATRAFSVAIHDDIGVAYDDLLLCQSNIAVKELKSARAQCENALAIFERERSVEGAKRALTSLAEIDLLENQPKSALDRLNRVLDHGGRDVVARWLEQIYELRARAYESLGQPDKALADYKEHMERFKASSEADRASDATAMRIRFETDREIERNAFLERELEARNEKIAAQTERMRWMIAAAITSTIVIVLLAYLLITYKRKKRALARLAQLDDLTQLPNRRRTFELASEAFDSARRAGMPLTIGILDLDHFKRINDQFGHATGDHVLREFARIGRSLIREVDVLGRWGGEEFLLVLPNATLDVALGIVDRLRTAASAIQGGPKAVGLQVTMSGGLATNEGDPAHLEEVIASADAALYDAKESGRNTVCVAPESYRLAATGVRRVLKDSGIALTTGAFELHRPQGDTTSSQN